MGKFEIPIVSIPRKSPLAVDEVADAVDLIGQDTDPGFLTRIRINGELSAIHKDFLFQGSVTGIFECPCDRCLEHAEVNASVGVAWLFEPDVTPDALEEFAKSDDTDEEEMENEDGETLDGETLDEEEAGQIRYYNGDCVNLAPHALEEMVMAAPTKFYCGDECKGLCPQCGINLNTTSCACVDENKETNNSGLNALKDLYPDLPSNTSEE
ncbi:MAG: DUF177 domain-containing protein [Candidatus Hydrogenedentota bacterium]